MRNPATRIYHGDALSRLRELPDESVHMVMTSPPYWGLRSYEGGDAMIGMEPTFAEHLERLVEVFDEVRRVLRNDGTLWLNYGDAYAHTSASGGETPVGVTKARADASVAQGQVNRVRGSGAKPKDLLLMPAEVVLALRDAGWWLRSEIIWHKPNPTPESARDRPTLAFDKLFLLSKRPRYYYDNEAVRTRQQPDSPARAERGRSAVQEVPPGQPHHSGIMGPRPKRNGTERPHPDPDATGTRNRGLPPRDQPPEAGANLRNVWTIPTYPYPGAHFATFPPKLVEPPVLAGTSAHGVCAECGAPCERVTESAYANPRNRTTNGPRSAGEHGVEPSRFMRRLERQSATVGWVAGCDCDAERVPATVLDPFGGAGTVALVANKLGRSAVLIEIGPDAVRQSVERIETEMGMFADVEVIE